MRIIAVDDERLALEDFTDMCTSIGGIDDLKTFNNPVEALKYATHEKIDVAFLDIEMPVIKGIDLAKSLHDIDPDIRVIFLTGFSEYALDAFSVDAVDYLMKPFSAEMLERALEKAARISVKSGKSRIFIQTFGYFDVFVDGKSVSFTSAKSKELLALLVDRRGGVVNTDQAIAVLWSGRDYDETTQSLFRKVLKSLRTALSEVGALEILVDSRNQRSVDITKFDSDYIAVMVNRDRSAAQAFNGKYMAQYQWAQQTVQQIAAACAGINKA